MFITAEFLYAIFLYDTEVFLRETHSLMRARFDTGTALHTVLLNIITIFWINQAKRANRSADSALNTVICRNRAVRRQVAKTLSMHTDHTVVNRTLRDVFFFQHRFFGIFLYAFFAEFHGSIQIFFVWPSGLYAGSERVFTNEQTPRKRTQSAADCRSIQIQ